MNCTKGHDTRSSCHLRGSSCLSGITCYRYLPFRPRGTVSSLLHLTHCAVWELRPKQHPAGCNRWLQPPSSGPRTTDGARVYCGTVRPSPLGLRIYPSTGWLAGRAHNARRLPTCGHHGSPTGCIEQRPRHRQCSISPRDTDSRRGTASQLEGVVTWCLPWGVAEHTGLYWPDRLRRRIDFWLEPSAGVFVSAAARRSILVILQQHCKCIP